MTESLGILKDRRNQKKQAPGTSGPPGAEIRLQQDGSAVPVIWLEGISVHRQVWSAETGDPLPGAEAEVANLQLLVHWCNEIVGKG